MRRLGAIALALMLAAAPLLMGQPPALAATSVHPKVAQAIHKYGRAAEHGDGEAFYKLGAINQRGGAHAKAYACYLLAAQLGVGATPTRARAALSKLAPRLSTQARHEAEELAAAWRMTIDR